MICIDILILQRLGIPETRIVEMRAAFPRTGVLPCYCFSFDAGGEGKIEGRSPSQWLACEAIEPQLLLIGCSDRYGAAARIGAHVTEIAVTTEGASRSLTPDEAASLPELFRLHGWSGADEVLNVILPSTDRLISGPTQSV